MIFKRKIYDELKKWKTENNGDNAILIEGARRVGKSVIVEEFGKHEYKSYIFINFSNTDEQILNLFKKGFNNPDNFFEQLQNLTNVELFKRQSLLIFDEVQECPEARQMIKHLVADGRYDYIETGSLISIRENVKNIVIPSEELKINMNPMDFEEFLWALNEHDLANTIKNSYKLKTPLSDKHHKLANFLFRRYLIVGGMPDSVKAFIKSSFQYEKSDFEKKKILNLYNDDIHKIKFNYRTKLLTLYKNLPSVLSRHDKRIIYDQIQKNSRSKNYTEPIFWLSDSKIANICYMVSDPRMPLRLSIKENFFKTYLNDTGLLFTQAFDTKIIRRDKLYSEIIMDNFHINEGMFFENVVAQTLTANGYDLLFYKHYNKEKHYDDMEIDFLIIFPFKDKYKISPIEVKSSKKYKLNSLLLFNKKFKSEIGYSFVVHTKNYKIDGNIIYLPIYMLFCLKED